ncbi:YdcF family protein [Calothrix rhizosoleniae]|uniref:YdcF family protein n=1 Tax=Calothrix rhizosoleniae TaxID=888997 RepID=UPI001F267129|nr:YdcF family protein [Calothrix rhizosoleniae]
MKFKLFKLYSIRFVWLVLIIALLLSSFISVRIAITFRQAPTPQAIFVLGSSSERMEFAGRFWQSRQNLDIWVSDFDSNLDGNRRIFERFGVPNQKLHLDGRASDTVTNFTSLVEDFSSGKLQHIYLITSDYHMRRARSIATIVLGNRGIVITPVGVVSRNGKSESVVAGVEGLWAFCAVDFDWANRC